MTRKNEDKRYNKRTERESAKQYIGKVEIASRGRAVRENRGRKYNKKVKRISGVKKYLEKIQRESNEYGRSDVDTFKLCMESTRLSQYDLL